MKQQYDKQEIAHLLSKFMAGETSVAEEEVLAQYFRTHEVDEDWAEYKEMFAMFDNGQVDIEPEADTNSQRPIANSQKPESVPLAVKEKPKIVTLRWLMAGIAASIALLLVFYLGRSTAEQPTWVAEKTVEASPHLHPALTGGESQPEHEAIIPTESTEQAVVAQTTSTKPQITNTKVAPTVVPKANSVSSAEDLANCIARLEAEMEKLDDSVSSAQVERLIAADARLQQMVNRIVGKQVEQALNKIQNDSTTNYVSF
ncbi:MAG: hypothetical protein J5552_10055 [Prevotella sp.]|nr:hypothetical protein [Prevotella sp.]MBR4898970.1 hypothetical protein [Prevotella sp.]